MHGSTIISFVIQALPSTQGMNDDNILDHLPKEMITFAYQRAKGNEIDSGKFLHPESSAALAGNAFGFFLSQPDELPPIPGMDSCGWR